jgi:hypothetical protein
MRAATRNGHGDITPAGRQRKRRRQSARLKEQHEEDSEYASLLNANEHRKRSVQRHAPHCW